MSAPLLDELFSDGPDGFLDGELSRARRYVCAINDLPLTPGELPAPTPYPRPEDVELPVQTGADAWQNEAMRRHVGLWSGDSRALQGALGTAPPEPLQKFEQATAGAKPYETFYELRLDTGLPAVPPEGVNLFEQFVLNDQLNFLGTALSEAFSGVVCIGTLRNGDSYHLEVDPPAGVAPTVVFFNHDKRSYERVFAKDLDAMVYLCALCEAVSSERVSEEVAQAGFEALREKVAPTWHFSIDEHDEDFEPLKVEAGSSWPLYAFWRAYWIICLLRHDSQPRVEDLREVFTEKLNFALKPEDVPKRLATAQSKAITALYTVWRAYLFDEPHLEECLVICRKHAARLVRDCAVLIDELRAGRKTLGRIEDWPAVLASVRALELDPRQAAAREARLAAEKAKATEERRVLLERIPRLEGAEELEAVAGAFSLPALNFPALLALLEKPARRAAKAAIDYLVQRRSSRNGKGYTYEDVEACLHAARAADPALALALLGIALFGSEAEEGQRVLDGRRARDILLRTKAALPAVGRAALVERIRALRFDQNIGWEGEMLPALAGALGVTEALPVLNAQLAKMPNEGNLGTAMTYDAFIAASADAFVALGATEVDELVRFASGSGLYMRKGRANAAVALARLKPEAIDKSVAKNLAVHSEQLNDAWENAAGLLAVAKSGAKPEGLESLNPSAGKYPQVQLALALARGQDPSPALELCFTKPAYDQKGDVEQCEAALLAMELFSLKAPPEVLRASMGLDPELDAALAKAGGLPMPRWLTVFECEAMSQEELRAVVADPSVNGREHALRRLEPVEEARPAVEAALRSLLELPRVRSRADYLSAEGVALLTELGESPSTVEVFDALLRSSHKPLYEAVLREPPEWEGLRPAMESIAPLRKGGWVGSTITAWLAPKVKKAKAKAAPKATKAPARKPRKK